MWWMGLLLEVLSAPWWELSVRLFASQEQPSPVGLIQAQGLEQRATRALLSALRVLRALKPGVCLALRVDPTAWLVQLWWLRVPWRQERQPQLVRWLREQSLQEMLSRALWLWETRPTACNTLLLPIAPAWSNSRRCLGERTISPRAKQE